MGKADLFTQFYPVLPNRFYPVAKSYRANTGVDTDEASVIYCWFGQDHGYV